MNNFIEHLVERNFQNKTIGIIENGTWAPMAAKIMKDKLANCKNLTILNPTVTILSSLEEKSLEQLDKLANQLSEEYQARKEIKEEKEVIFDKTALFKIEYGLYVVTSNDGKKDNGLIVNTVTQLTDTPFRVAVNINKANYSHEVIKATKKMNVNILSQDTTFDVIKKYGFVSGRDANKFEGEEVERSSNGLVILPNHVNAVLSLEVESYVDLDTHGMFICKVIEAKKLNNNPTLTYNYYQSNVKPKPEEKKKGYVCKVCGYVYEGDELPDDFICPLCKHGASDFEKL
jgi:flavin reductase (DIM6/NTAB) family NADH-FMN oxidoreductase RutF